MKYIVTNLQSGKVRSCTEEEVEEMRCMADFMVLIDHDERVSYWLTFSEEVLLDD